MLDFSPKQKEVWRGSVEQFHRWNISDGAVRSGKTYLDYFKIPYRIRRAGDKGLILLLGNTQGTLERNILEPMRKIWTPALVGHIGHNNKIRLFGRDCYAMGADKISQAARLQGSGIKYCYGDEIVTWSEDVFRMLQSRLDQADSCFDGTCNPGHPQHWFKKFLDSDADIYHQSFTLDDNPFISAAFVENLKREYAGTVYYDRLILGKWVAAEGVIYRAFADNPQRFIVTSPPPVAFSIIGVDFGGNKSAHAFNCTGFYPNLRGIVTLDEFYSKKELAPSDLEREFVSFVKKQMVTGHKVIEIRADSAEPVLIRGLRNALIREKIGIPIHNAIKGAINDRIRLFLMLMGADKYKVMAHCEHTIQAFAGALWDSKKLDDIRLDDGTTNIDSLDAQEYAVEPYLRQLIDLMMLGVA